MKLYHYYHTNSKRNATLLGGVPLYKKPGTTFCGPRGGLSMAAEDPAAEQDQVHHYKENDE